MIFDNYLLFFSDGAVVSLLCDYGAPGQVCWARESDLQPCRVHLLRLRGHDISEAHQSSCNGGKFSRNQSCLTFAIAHLPCTKKIEAVSHYTPTLISKRNENSSQLPYQFLPAAVWHGLRMAHVLDQLWGPFTPDFPYKPSTSSKPV